MHNEAAIEKSLKIVISDNYEAAGYYLPQKAIDVLVNCLQGRREPNVGRGRLKYWASPAL